MLNKQIIIGHLGSDPEVRYTNSGTQVTTFSVATTEKWKDKDGQLQEETDWHRVVAWNRLADNCAQLLSKGARVYIEGRTKHRKWQDQEGKDKYTTEIVAREMILLTPRSESNSRSSEDGGGSGGYQDTGNDAPGGDESDTPF